MPTGMPPTRGHMRRRSTVPRWRAQGDTLMDLSLVPYLTRHPPEPGFLPAGEQGPASAIARGVTGSCLMQPASRYTTKGPRRQKNTARGAQMCQLAHVRDGRLVPDFVV